MAEIEEALTTYLLAQSGLTALIGGRFFPDLLEDDATLPAVVYLNISDVKDHTLDGQLALESPVIQFTAYATTKSAAKAVAAQLKTALSDYHGTLSGITVQYIKLLNELSSVDTSADGMVKVWTTDLEYEVNYNRA
jgi:hypothetical protein